MNKPGILVKVEGDDAVKLQAMADKYFGGNKRRATRNLLRIAHEIIRDIELHHDDFNLITVNDVLEKVMINGDKQADI